MSLLYKNGDWDFWARGSMIRKIFGVGSTYRMNKDTTISNELLYDVKGDDKMKGIMGSPLFWRYGATHKFGNGLNFEARMMASNNSLWANMKSSTNFDKNTKFTLNWIQDIPQQITDP